VTSRRSFLRLLAGAVSSLALSLPAEAAADRRLPFEFHFPQDAAATYFSNTFGYSKEDGRRHEGIDLMAPKMTPVYAAAGGSVLRVGSSPRAGRYLVLAHHDDWETWYLHLNNDRPGRDDGRADFDLTVAPDMYEGAGVAAGQLIAWVGDSGNAEGTLPHTHFELHHRNRILNPYRHLLEAYHRARIEGRLEAFGTLPPA
jgi:murein DD-endopeptidase MepM/ murein hydrolase activator NlpD